MRRPVVLLALVLIALLGSLAAAPLLEQPPATRTTATDGQFDAQQAKNRLAVILGDQQPHPADSAYSDAVRGRLIAELQQIGLKPIVRDQFACNTLYKQRGVSCARVRNVIAVLGPPQGKALLLNAHYDSTPVGPAASDDGIGVATLLEVARNLRSRPLKRPIILLFNEGEELGLIGARAFLADPLSRNVDALVNLEARGVSGPVNMFETSRPNAAAIRVFAAAVRNPVANSLSTDVYRLMPNYTDVNSFAERGWLTLNLAPIGNETRYHSPGDTVAALDPATLQHMGDQTLSLAEALADGTPRAAPSDRIFMDVAGQELISLPLIVGVVLLVGLLIAFAVIAVTRGGLIRSGAVVVGTIVGSPVLSWLLLALVGLVRPGMFWRAYPIWSHLTVYALTVLCGVALIAGLGGDRTRLRATFWFVFAVLGGALGLFAPGGIVFFIFPPLVFLCGIVAKRWWRSAEQVAAVVAIVILYLTWGAMLGLLQELLNVGPLWIFALLGSLLILPVLIEARPLIAAAGPRVASVVAGLLTLFSLGAVLAAPAYSADRRQRFVVQRITDAASGKSWWSILNDGAPLPKALPGAWSRGTLLLSDRPRWLSPAPADPTARAPDIKLVSQSPAGTGRILTVRLTANGNERLAFDAPPDAQIVSAGSAGFIMPIDRREGGKTSINCAGRSCDGAVLQIKLGDMRPVTFMATGTRPLDAAAAPLLAARPRFARPQYSRDEAIAFTGKTL